MIRSLSLYALLAAQQVDLNAMHVCPPTTVTAEARSHQVTAGEHLIGILRRARLVPIYGPKGSLSQTWRLNRWLHNLDHILVGQLIVLPSASPQRPTAQTLGSSSVCGASCVANEVPLSASLGEKKPITSSKPLFSDHHLQAKDGLPISLPKSGVASKPLGRPQTNPFLHLATGPSWTFDLMVANDPVHHGQARLLSLVGPGFQLAADFSAWRSLALVAQMSARLVTFNQPAQASVLEPRQQPLGRAAVGASLAPAAPWRVQLLAGVAREVFLQAETTTAATLATAAVPELSAEVERAILLGRAWQVGLAAEVRLASGPRWVRLGGELAGLARLSWRPATGLSLAGHARYAYRRQNTLLTHQSLHRLALYVALEGQLP